MVATALVVAVVCAGVIVHGLVSSWRYYGVRALDLTVELPVAPEAASANTKAGITIYEANTADVAVVMAAFPHAGGTEEGGTGVAQRSMAYLEQRPDVAGLRSEVTRLRGRQRPTWRVAATFTRHGVPSRAEGIIVSNPDALGQVLCLFSTGKGARAARRVLASARFGE